MRWKIIVVNATIVALVAVLSYVLLATSLRGVLADPNERRRELEQALRAADAQLALDALRLERWLEANGSSDSVKTVFSLGTPSARSEAATAEANRPPASWRISTSLAVRIRCASRSASGAEPIPGPPDAR